jgi:carboxyl-terminal processing protease
MYRNEILKYGDVATFSKEYVLTDAMFDELMRRTEEKKIQGTEDEKAKARELSEPLFKAYVARNVFGDEAFYPLYEPLDEILQEAIDVLED